MHFAVVLRLGLQTADRAVQNAFLPAKKKAHATDTKPSMSRLVGDHSKLNSLRELHFALYK
jgi:hypothetical protein